MKPALSLATVLFAACLAAQPRFAPTFEEQAESLRLAVENLSAVHGAGYPEADIFLERLHVIEGMPAGEERRPALEALRRRALLENPAIDFDRILLVRFAAGQRTFPPPFGTNTMLPCNEYDAEIAILSDLQGEAKLDTFFKPTDGAFVGEIDLEFDAERLLFTMPVDGVWHLHEMAVHGRGHARQLTPPTWNDVHNFDACYLPDGTVAFASTGSFHAVPCFNGIEEACNLFRLETDGSVRRLTFDQDIDSYPVVLPNGQILFSRWDYTGIMHMYLRPMMVMNPDGTGERAVYGSNSWWPNAFFHARPLPGSSSRLAGIATGHHGAARIGDLVILDTAQGWTEAQGVVQRIPGRGQPVEPVRRDKLIPANPNDRWTFLHPYPLDNDNFLVSARPPGEESRWKIYLVDTFDNLVELAFLSGHDLYEPIPLRRNPRPPVIPTRVRPEEKNGTLYLHDIYTGPGLEGVPRGKVALLRILAYHFGYPGVAGPNKIGLGGPMEAMRILGTVEVESDGSAMFVVPANTPVALQPLDADGRAVQLMRSWLTVKPGEMMSCIGCHESPGTAPPAQPALAIKRAPQRIEEWHGPARGFDFEREVQPVLDHYCVSCHHPASDRWRPDLGMPDLRPESSFPDYDGHPATRQTIERLHPSVAAKFGDKLKFTPAYAALLPFVRRVGMEDDVDVLEPTEYHTDTSELIQILEKGHHGVELARRAWDAFETWIDLNAPCHGTWGEVHPIPDGVDQRRLEMIAYWGGPEGDPEAIPEIPAPVFPPFKEANSTEGGRRDRTTTLPGWPWRPGVASAKQRALGDTRRSLDLGGGVSLKLARVPSGAFIMGEQEAANQSLADDERSTRVVTIDEPYWIGAFEVTNEQFRQFDPAHDSRGFFQRLANVDGHGMTLDADTQPVTRVTWTQAIAFCDWLSEKTGCAFTLPTEEQWEFACRAGSSRSMYFGEVGDDFSAFANLADKALSEPSIVSGSFPSAQWLLPTGGIPCDISSNDGAVVTAPVGQYEPNAWGLHDMHGNVAEWTRTVYRPNHASPGPGYGGSETRRVVKGGSFYDRPKRARAASKLAYPEWRPVFNVGFRVVCEDS